MEIIKDEKTRKCGAWKEKNIYLGVVLILVGIVWLLDNFNLIDSRFFDVVFSWQMLLVVIGGYLLSTRNWAAGGTVMLIGVCFLLTDIFNVCLPIGKLILPLIFIAGGVSLVLSRKR